MQRIELISGEGLITMTGGNGWKQIVARRLPGKKIQVQIVQNNMALPMREYDVVMLPDFRSNGREKEAFIDGDNVFFLDLFTPIN